MGKWILILIGIIILFIILSPPSNERYNKEVVELAGVVNNISLYFINNTNENLGTALYLSNYISKKFKMDKEMIKSIQISEKAYSLNEYIMNIDLLINNIKEKSKEIITKQNITKEEADSFINQVGESSGKGFFIYQSLKGKKVTQITDLMVSLSNNQTFKNDYEDLKKNITKLENEAFNISGEIGKEIFPTIIKSKIVIEDEVIPILNDILINLQNISTNKSVSGEI